MQYNNIHYWAIAEIVALVSQSAYPDYVQTHILDPLNMTDSYYNHTLAEETGNRVEPFVRADINYTRCMEVWAEDNELDRSCYGRPFPAQWLLRGDGLYFAGPGGLVTSTSDMVCSFVLQAVGFS
jgi:CubicO group peptidase (beta-lactamase class C family)